MENTKRRILPGLLAILGGLLAALALFMLSRTPETLQYAVVAPAPGEQNVNYTRLAAAARDAAVEMGDAAQCVAIGGVKAQVSLSAGERSEMATLFAMGEGFPEVYPHVLKGGRRISETELAAGARLILLDEALAFRLFGTQVPDEAVVTLEGVRYTVAGMVRHAGSLLGGRGVGDTETCDCYVPLGALPDGFSLDTLTLSAKPRNASGAAQLFSETASGRWLAGGTLVNLPKEAMRATILPRVLLLIVGLFLLAGLFRRVTALSTRGFRAFRARLAQRYIGALIPRLIGLILRVALGYAAVIALAWLLLTFSAQPLYVFTEWVPENIVEWSSLTKVFWNLTADAGKLVRVGTRELRVVAFWGGALRWGVFLLLTGVALTARPFSRRENKK